MLRLEIAAPKYRIFKTVLMFFQQRYGFCIGHMGKVRLHQGIQSLQKALVEKFVEKFHLIRTVLQQIPDHVLDHIPRQIHIIL